MLQRYIEQAAYLHAGKVPEPRYSGGELSKAAVKTLHSRVLDNEVIDSPPKLRAVKKITIKRQDKPTFTVSQVRKSVQNASPQMKAMIRLGLNCGPIFG